MRLSVPVPLKIGLVVLGTTGLYTYIGQLVPQKEVLPPPAETVIAAEATPEQLVEVGRQIAENKGICLTCHTIGQSGGALRFPDLAGVGARAETRVPGLDGVGYLAQSLYEPNSFIVPGFSPGMPTINKPPIGLSDDEIKAVIAWLQSMGGTPTVTMATDLGYGG
jgi:mono/diheme cytochrome c family protein